MRAALTSFWNEPQVADAPRRVWRDWVLVAAIVSLSVVEVLVREEVTYRWVSFVVAVAGAPLILWRRTHPLPVTCALFGVTVIMAIPWIIQGSEGDLPGLYTMGYVVLMPYAVFRWASGRHALIALGVMMVSALTSLIWDYSGLAEAIGGFAVFFGTMELGLAMRYRMRARMSKLDQARAQERESLARELHDTVAHHVSAIAIRAQAGLAVAPTDPAAAVDALRVIDAEASRTLAEMRTIVRTLRRDDGVEMAPLPGLADVHRLAQTSPGEPVVRIEMEGDAATVPAPVAAAAYRLVQESITNARRHARRATRIDVTVRTGDDDVRVQVTDDGEVAGRAGEGYGIVGMVERAERLGGSLSAGPREGRGWAVSAVLPLRGVEA